jgi:hypothetical protein
MIVEEIVPDFRARPAVDFKASCTRQPGPDVARGRSFEYSGLYAWGRCLRRETGAPGRLKRRCLPPRRTESSRIDYVAIDLGPELFLDALRCIRLTWSRYLTRKLCDILLRRFDLPYCRLD